MMGLWTGGIVGATAVVALRHFCSRNGRLKKLAFEPRLFGDIDSFYAHANI